MSGERLRRESPSMLFFDEIMTLVEVVQQARPSGMPVQFFPGQCAGRRIVQCREESQEPEVAGPFFRRNADDRHTEVAAADTGDGAGGAADDPGDAPEGPPLVGDPL